MRISCWPVAILYIVMVLFQFANAGVEGLTKYFRRSYKHTWTEVKKKHVTKVDHLLIDMNQLLHSGPKKCRNRSHFIALLFSNIDRLLKTVSPNKTLVLAFDGPAPFSKMTSQRKRRQTNSGHAEFTPGTDLMNSMENLMICYTLQRVQRPDFKNLTVFISGAQVPGEGELKLVEWINDHMPNHNDSCIICGSDSDIILQAISLLNVPDLRVLQSGGGYPTAFCNVTQIIDGLYEAVKNESALLDTDMPDSHNFRFDIITLFIMQGNDYLPKLKSININKALRYYGRAMKRLPPQHKGFLLNSDKKSNSFNFAALWAFLDEAENDENIILPVKFPTVTNTLYNLLMKFPKNNATGESEEEQMCVYQDFEKYEDSFTLSSDIDHEISQGVTSELRSDGSSLPPAGSSMTRVTVWGSTLEIKGKNYTTDAMYRSKRAARAVAAELALLDIDKTAYQSMLEAQSEAMAKLRRMRETVILESAGEISKLFDIDIINTRGEESFPDLLAAPVDTSVDDEDTGLTMTSVSSEEYTKYLRDVDSQVYLSGILWVIQMYIDGVCPDVTYSFMGHTPTSTLALKRYIEKVYWRNHPEGTRNRREVSLDDLLHPEYGIISGKAADDLRESIRVPKKPSVASLSGAAACVCVLPEAAEEFVPVHLRPVWRAMQSFFSQKIENDDYQTSNSTRYEELTNHLVEVWGSVGTDRKQNLKSSEQQSSAQHSSRPEQVASESLPEKRWRAKASPIDGFIFGSDPFSAKGSKLPQQGVQTNVYQPRSSYERSISYRGFLNSNRSMRNSIHTKNEGVFALPTDAAWVIITPTENLSRVGYISSFKRQNISFPLQLPKGYRAFTTLRTGRPQQ